MIIGGKNTDENGPSEDAKASENETRGQQAPTSFRLSLCSCQLLHHSYHFFESLRPELGQMGQNLTVDGDVLLLGGTYKLRV